MNQSWKHAVGAMMIGTLLISSGCITSTQPLPTTSQVRIPEAIQGNSGKYMCPYTSDDTVAEWVTTGMKASLGSSVGSAAGAYAGQKAMGQIPFVGGFLGSKAGAAVGRSVAIQASGGMGTIKEQSDLSFNSVDHLAVYLYAKHSSHPDFQKVYKLTTEVYPELGKRYYAAIRNARVL